MQILEHISLAKHSTMRLGGNASYACEITSHDDLLQALEWATEHKQAIRVIGSGSNIIWSDSGYDGLLIINSIRRFELFNEDEANTYLTLGAGEPWDAAVERSVRAGLSGIEALSLIPGTSGATPIQNVGAYGQEISQSIATIEAYDTVEKSFVTIPGYDCGFGYRTSRFKTNDQGRFIITAITLHLLRTAPLPPFYPAVASYLEQHKLSASAASIRDAVVSIRSMKLPDPSVIGNTGSFFENPIISAGDFIQLQSDHPEPQIPHWEVGQSVKISGAWLIEQSGFKDFHDPATGMATWGTQPLVLVNEHATCTADLLAFKQLIVNAVASKYGIQLTQEPELVA